MRPLLAQGSANGPNMPLAEPELLCSSTLCQASLGHPAQHLQSIQPLALIVTIPAHVMSTSRADTMPETGHFYLGETGHLHFGPTAQRPIR
jgi:hypothetical protein